MPRRLKAFFSLQKLHLLLSIFDIEGNKATHSKNLREKERVFVSFCTHFSWYCFSRKTGKCLWSLKVCVCIYVHIKRWRVVNQSNDKVVCFNMYNIKITPKAHTVWERKREMANGRKTQFCKQLSLHCQWWRGCVFVSSHLRTSAEANITFSHPDKN